MLPPGGKIDDDEEDDRVGADAIKIAPERLIMRIHLFRTTKSRPPITMEDRKWLLINSVQSNPLTWLNFSPKENMSAWSVLIVLEKRLLFGRAVAVTQSSISIVSNNGPERAWKRNRTLQKVK